MYNKGLIDGRYRIKRVLGKGCRSRVYLAENIKLGTLWAIKQIEKEDNLQLLEPEMLKRLDHPSLPKIYDVTEDEKHVYLIVDYIEGDSLDKKLKEEGAFPEWQVVKWGIQLCEVLSYLHGISPNPIIYRDMKPSNILLTKGDRIKLVDFGIAREYKPGNPDDTVYIGTRGYAAPEQYGSGQTSAASDIYSLGVTLHHLATGVVPDAYPGESRLYGEHDADVSEEFLEIIKKCTWKIPGDRYRSATELREALEALCCGQASQRPEKTSNTKVHGFRRALVGVWGNAEFACEFAYVCAKLSGLKVLLIDLDLLAPSVDLLLNLPKYPAGRRGSILKSSGLDMLFDALESGRADTGIFDMASVKRREMDNLFAVTGSYNLSDYEYYSGETLVRILDDAYREFDITILVLNQSIYDVFTIITLGHTDYNIIPLRGEVLPLRTFNRYREFLFEKQGIRLDKHKFVAFDHDISVSPDRLMMDMAAGDAYLGWVRSSKKRNEYRNLKKAYVKSIEPDVENDYRKLLDKLGITAREKYVAKLKRMIKKKKERHPVQGGSLEEGI